MCVCVCVCVCDWNVGVIMTNIYSMMHITFNVSGILIYDIGMLFPNWQKESWQTFEETSGYVRLERVNSWPNSMTDI